MSPEAKTLRELRGKPHFPTVFCVCQTNEYAVTIRVPLQWVFVVLAGSLPQVHTAQDLFFLPAARIQLDANSPTLRGSSGELGVGDSLKGYWICARGWTAKGKTQYPASGFDLRDRVHGLGLGVCLKEVLFADWSLQYIGYVDYWWGSRVVSGNPLYWVGSYKENGVHYGLGLRTCHRLGQVVHLLFGAEGGYRQVGRIEEVNRPTVERPIGDGFFGAFTVGLWLPFRIESMEGGY